MPAHRAIVAQAHESIHHDPYLTEPSSDTLESRNSEMELCPSCKLILLTSLVTAAPSSILMKKADVSRSVEIEG